MRPLVLVIDSDSKTSVLLKGTASLTGTSFDVRAVPDGPRAVRWVSENRADLIVLAAELPDGAPWPTVIGDLRKAGAVAPVILVAGAGAISTAEAFALGVRDVLHRPLTAPALRASLTAALADVHYRQSAQPAVAAPKPAAERARTAPPTVSEFDVLYAVGKTVTSLDDIDEIMRRVVDAAVFISGAEQGYLILVDEDSHELVIRAARSQSDPLARTLRLTTTDTLARQVLLTGKSVLLSGDRETKIKTSSFLRAALYVPLTLTGQTIGVLAVTNQQARWSFTTAEQRFLSAIADYAAIAIENARLFREARDRAAAREAVYKELQEADKFKAQMIQNLSHELSTPLLSVQGYVHLLVTGALMPVPADVQETLNTVQNRVTDLVRVVENMQALSEPAQLAVVVEKVELNKLVQSAIDNRLALAARSQLAIIGDLPQPPLQVVADAKLVARVVANLLDNAIKFSPNGGLITVSARPLDGQPMAEVLVSDSGVGIPAEKLDKIFESFYQVDGTATRRFGGTGLGLAAAREIIRAHGGELKATSKPGQGSIFRFTLYLS
ncbi:MAG: GAF domain-containing protein, partial [Chloroflexi bacterium]|nr:GAF domain-containing protein [Chloroflexota bacterium]